MYLADTHTHTRVSPDCDAPLADQAAAARAAGMDGLWITDHFDLLDFDGHDVTEFDWPAALEQFHAVKASVGDALELRLGLELGSATRSPEAARAVLAQPGGELDFVLGSMHNWIGIHGNIDFYSTDFTGDRALCMETMDNVLDHTWTLVTQLPDCYDSLAHIIYPLRYFVRDGHDLTILDWEDRARAILTEVARTGHAMEVNTNKGRDLASWPVVLRWFKEQGGRYVTVGSDAHRPEDMARGIREGVELVRAAGLDYTVFRGRKPCVIR